MDQITCVYIDVLLSVSIVERAESCTVFIKMSDSGLALQVQCEYISVLSCLLGQITHLTAFNGHFHSDL